MAVVEITGVSDGIATMVLQGGRANALGDAFCRTLLEALERARVDEAIRGLLITGQGRFFSAGRDLREADDLGPVRPVGNIFETAMRAAFSFPKPMVAAVNGHAIAGGLVLALAADHCVLAEADYKLGLTELDIGLPFPRVAFEILRAAAPAAAVTRLAYGADLMGPAEAFKLGIGQELTPADDLQDQAMAWLRPVAERPLLSFALCKRWLREDALGRIDGQGAAEQQMIAEASGSAETRERLAAYAERLRR